MTNVVLINLDNSKNRLEKMQMQFDTINLPFKRFSAIYGKKLEKNILKEKTSFICNKVLCNYSMIGCALSHMEIIRDFYLNSKEQFICVMEDDIILSDKLPKFLSDIPSIYEKLNFDVISLFCLGICQNLESKIQVEDYSFTKPMFPLSATCYVLSRKGAEKIFQMIGDKVTYHIDFSIAFSRIFNKLDYYVLLNPKLISLEDGDSTMGSNSKSLLINSLRFCGAEKTIWFLNVPAFAINLKYTITIYLLLLLFLLIILLVKKWYLLAAIILVEIFLLLYTSEN